MHNDKVTHIWYLTYFDKVAALENTTPLAERQVLPAKTKSHQP
jgi:hypothetical protein